jgi:protein-tyrosine phosphatase
MVVCKGEPYASEILPGVWLGTEISANNIDFLNKYKIKNIIRILDTAPSLNDFTYLHIPMKSEKICDTDMTDYFNNAFDFITDSILNKQNILVHCKRGHHRSATLMVAYLVEKLNMDIHKVVSYIRLKRKCGLRYLHCMVQKYIEYRINYVN